MKMFRECYEKAQKRLNKKKICLFLMCYSDTLRFYFPNPLNSTFKGKLIQFAMLKVFSGINGTDILTKNTQGYLIYEWSRAPNLESFSYKVIAKDIARGPAISCSNGVINIYYSNSNKEIKHVQINQQTPLEKIEKVLVKNVNGAINPKCVAYGNKVFVYYVDLDGKMKEVSHTIQGGKEMHERFIDERKGEKTMLKTFKTEQDSFLFFKKISSLYWISLKKDSQKVTQKFVKLPFTPNSKRNYEVYERNGVLFIYMLSENNEIYEICLDQAEEKIKSANKIGDLKVEPLNPISLVADQQRMTVWFASGKHQIANYSRLWEEEQWNTHKFAIKQTLGSCFSIKQFKDNLKLFFLDEKQILAKYDAIQEGNQLKLSSKSLPYLIWELIQDKAKVVGRGYWTEVYSHQNFKGIAIKKFRTCEHSTMIEKEVKNQMKLEKIEPNMVSHRLYEKGVLMGFTLPLLKGSAWHEMIKNKDSLINRSSVARVKLLISLAEHIRAIQKINLCHGDIHMGNIIINVNEESKAEEPEVWAKVIDFGNAFDMIPGTNVSVTGLTGAMNLIPKEVHDAKWKNYNPFGMNAHQLAVIGLMFLLREPFTCQFKAEEKVKNLNTTQYPAVIKHWFEELVHQNIERRNKALNQDIRIFEELTRTIYIENCYKIEIHEEKILKSVSINNNQIKKEKVAGKAPTALKKVEQQKKKVKSKVNTPKIPIKSTKVVKVEEKVETKVNRIPVKGKK